MIISYSEGNSAVSPPIRGIPAFSQPFLIEFKTVKYCFSSILEEAK